MFVQTPLALKLRPQKISEILGQEHLTGHGKILYEMVYKTRPQHFLLWGPPGTGKTTIAHALSVELDIGFRKLNASSSGVKELRQIIKTANDNKLVLVVDEIHRWAKNVQDCLLEAIENNLFIFIGLTVENARFAVVKSLLSRCLVLETKPFDNKALITLFKRVKKYYKSLDKIIQIDKETLKKLIIRVSGDARKLLMVLETLVEIMSDDGVITEDDLNTVIPTKVLFFDVSGSERYDYAHCYQESIQNSDADAAIYWLAKWIESGEDPAYICRRMLITAFEDCAGNPLAAPLAMAACYATERTGLPECDIAMALATCEMAKSKRNKSAYNAIREARADVINGETIHVPPQLRAGTSGYYAAIRKTYLRDWERDASALEPNQND